MKRVITLFAALIVTVSMYAQGGLKIIPAQKYSNPSSVQLHPCIADTMYFSIGTQSGGNFATGDIVQLDIFLPQGIGFGGYYNATPGQTVIAGPNSFNVSILDGVSSFLFKYTIIPGCNYFSSGTTTGLRDSIVAYLNNGWASTDTLAYTVTSPYMVFSPAGSENIQYDQGEFNQTFQRRMTFVNTTSVPFNGEAEFADDTWLDILNTAVEFIHDTAYIIGVGTVGITGNTLTPIQVRINMLINGLQNGDTLVVEETLKLKACPGTQSDNTNTRFTLNYGCVGDLCKNTGLINTEVNLDMSYQPDLDYKLVDPSYAVCIGNEVNRIVRIINTGGGATDTVRIQYLGSRKKPSYIDTTTYKIYKKDNLGNPVYMTFDDRFGNPSYNIVRELVCDVPLIPGDSMFFSYTEVFDCIDTVDYVSYFNNVLNVNDYYIKVCLEKRCYNTVCKDADNNYHGWDTWKHSYSLGQVFNNMNGMMSDNDVAWFDIPNQSMLHPGDNTNKRMGCNPDSSVIEVELNLGAGLGLVYGAIDSIELRSNHNGAYDYIYPFEVVYVCGTGSIRATGDKAYARFRIPPTFFTNLVPTDYYNNGDKAQLNSLFDDFFGNFSVRFKLKANCDYAAQHGGKAEVRERVFFVYNMPCDSSCKIPLAEVKDFVQVNCPGCELPGWNLKTFTIERRNIDYPDTNNNHYPDVYPLTGTAAGADRSEVMQGDTIDCSLMGFATSGAMTFGDMGFPYKFARLELTGPVVKHFAFLKASGRYKSNGAVMPFTVPTASGRFTPNGFYIDLSIDTLKLKYVLTPALIDSFNVNDTIWIDTLAFRVNDNLTNGSGANPYFSLETIDAILHMSGTVYDGTIKSDALVVYEDPATWNSLTIQDKKNLTYWCTGATGKIIGIGYSFNHAAYIKNFSQSPVFPGNCYKQIMFKSFGDAGTQGNYSNILQEYVDGNTGTWNAFSYELRNLWMADSIRFEFPGEFSPIRVELQPTSLMYDASINQIRYNFDPVYSANCMYNVPLAQTRIAGNTITIYPDSMMTQDTQGPARPCDSSLSGWGETKRYRAYLTLTMNDYHLTPDIIATPPGTFPVVSYWYNYPGTITGDTSIVDTLKGYPWTQYFDKPSIVLKTQTVPHLPVDNDFTWNVNINSTDSITQDKVNNWTDSSFVYLKSPTGNITVTTVQWQSGGTVPIKSIFDSGNLYALGAVGVEVGGPLSGMNISKNIKVDAHFNCANGNKDSLMLITGWNCYHYPSDLPGLAGACFLDTTWLVVQVEDCDIQMQILNPPDTVSVCDTVKYKILLDASGIGNINNTQLHILTPAGNELSYIAGSTTVYYLQDSLNYNSPLEPVDSSATSGVYGWYTWQLDNIPFVQNHFSAGGSDLIVEFSLLTGCSFETNGVNIAVTAINYCGKIIGPTVINHHPLFVTDKPVADSLTVTVVSDTLKLCDSSVNADLLIQNNGTIPTNGTNIISLTLPPNLTIAGGTTPDSTSGNIVYWTAGMLAAGGTESIHVVFNTASCPPYTYGLQLQSLKTLMCNGDTCDYAFVVANFTSIVIPIETPDASFTLLNDTICLGETLNFAGVDTCMNHTWNFGDGTFVSTQYATHTYATAGTFTIIHTEFDSCYSVSDTAIITVIPINVATSNDTTICAGDSVTLTASGATTYVWNTGVSTSSTTVNPIVTTTYVVTGTNNGCSATDAVVVNVIPNPVVNAGIDQTICSGQTATLNASGATTYEWSNGVSTGSTTVSPIVSTTYTVTGTTNGCTGTDEVIVNVGSTVTADFTYNSIDSGCVKVGAVIQFTGAGSGTAGWLWNFGDGTTSTLSNPTHVFNDFGFHCVSLTYTNVCGSATATKSIYVMCDSCPCNIDYEIDSGLTVQSNMVITPSTYSTNVIDVKGDIIVKTNVTLELRHVTMKMHPLSRIIVEPRGRLDLYQTILDKEDHCEMWQGIEVWGDPNALSSSTTQGWARFFFSTVKNAQIGVLSGKRNMHMFCQPQSVYPYDLNYSGGVIRNIYMHPSIGSAKFENNGTDIRFVTKTNTDGSYNWIEKDTFICKTLADIHYNSASSNPYPNSLNPWAGSANQYQRTDAGIYIENLKGLKVKKCVFRNKQYGMLSFDSKYDVENSFFTKMRYGIRIENTLSNLDNRHEIYSNVFDSIPGDNSLHSAAIYINGGKYDYVHDNFFGRTITSQTINLNAIHTNNASAFNISENDFRHFNFGVKSVNTGTSGGYIGAWYGNNIFPWTGNVFTECKTNIFTGSNNQNLKLKCNSCNNTSAGLYSVNFYNQIGGTLGTQGSPAPPYGSNSLKQKYGAGNAFNPPITGRKRIESFSTYKYYRHSSPSNVIPEPVGPINAYSIGVAKTSNLIACPPPIPIPYLIPGNLSQNSPLILRIDSLKTIIQTLENTLANIESNIDQGQTQQLIADMAALPEGQLKNKLLTCSPLSDSVIKRMIFKNVLSNGNYKNVMIQNLPVSADVEPWFFAKQQNLPPGIASQLEALQANNPNLITPTGYFNAIHKTRNELLMLQNQIIIGLIDSANTGKALALQILENDPQVGSQQTLVSTYIADGLYTQASTKLNQITQTDEETQDWKQLSSMIESLYENGRTLYDMDATQISFVRTLANKCPEGLGTANAQAILMLLYREEMPECNPEENVRFTTNNEVVEISEGYRYLGENYPDPFSESTMIPYYLPEGMTGKIIIKDMPGKNLREYNLSEGENILEVKRESLEPGVYLYCIEISNNSFECKKMIIIK
ncbi:MAG: PKD domain-containing protein [Bacteroidota bacterium]